MTLPLPEQIKSGTLPIPEEKPSGKLTEHEYGYILTDCLSSKHRDDENVIAFIDSFVRCKNIRQASEDAGVHYSLGYKIRHRKDVAAAITAIIDKSTVKHGFDASEVLERAKEIVDFDPIMVQNPDGTFKSNMHDIPPEARRNIKKMKVKNLYVDQEDINGMKTKIIVGELIEYEFYDKQKAIDQVGKEKNMFKTTTVHEHSVTKDMANVLLASKQLADQHIEKINQPKTIEAEVIKDDDRSNDEN